IWLHSELLGQAWFSQLKIEMDSLDVLARNLYGRVIAFFNEQTVDGSKLAAQATQLFWQLCERDFQSLVASCDGSEQATRQRQQHPAGTNALSRQFSSAAPRIKGWPHACGAPTIQPLNTRAGRSWARWALIWSGTTSGYPLLLWQPPLPSRKPRPMAS